VTRNTLYHEDVSADRLPVRHRASAKVYMALLQEISMSLLIQEVPVTNAPMELLLLADPSEDKIRSYLSGSKCFVASSGAIVVGACVAQPRSTDTYELMSIAVVLLRPRFGLDPDAVAALLDYVDFTSDKVASVPLGERLPGPDDEAFLEVAVASGAEYLVTGNLVHFPAEACMGVSVVSPAVFVEAYRSA
jgi:hypothetical protein